eukprot:Rhum_TRINITY_DN14767_c11_g1::Rhum_TRINITY_DN14767_c11_g1_i1::g.116824::m.116824
MVDAARRALLVVPDVPQLRRLGVDVRAAALERAVPDAGQVRGRLPALARGLLVAARVLAEKLLDGVVALAEQGRLRQVTVLLVLVQAHRLAGRRVADGEHQPPLGLRVLHDDLRQEGVVVLDALLLAHGRDVRGVHVDRLALRALPAPVLEEQLADAAPVVRGGGRGGGGRRAGGERVVVRRGADAVRGLRALAVRAGRHRRRCGAPVALALVLHIAEAVRHADVRQGHVVHHVALRHRVLHTDRVLLQLDARRRPRGGGGGRDGRRRAASVLGDGGGGGGSGVLRGPCCNEAGAVRGGLHAAVAIAGLLHGSDRRDHFLGFFLCLVCVCFRAKL